MQGVIIQLMCASWIAEKSSIIHCFLIDKRDVFVDLTFWHGGQEGLYFTQIHQPHPPSAHWMERIGEITTRTKHPSHFSYRGNSSPLLSLPT